MNKGFATNFFLESDTELNKRILEVRSTQTKQRTKAQRLESHIWLDYQHYCNNETDET